MLLRRFLVLQMLLLWQGGFLFYALVVVPVGTELLGSATAQGIVTARVTLWLNRIGWLALFAFALDARMTTPRKMPRFVWIGIATLLHAILVFGLHGPLLERLDFEEHRIRGRDGFYTLHRWYLILSAVQWLAMLAFASLTLAAWRAADSDPGAALRRIFNRR